MKVLFLMSVSFGIAFTYNNLTAFINYSAGVPVVLVLSLYLQYIKGLDPQYAGIILAVQPVVMTIFSPFAGRLSDKIEARVVVSIGMGLLHWDFLYSHS